MSVCAVDVVLLQFMLYILLIIQHILCILHCLFCVSIHAFERERMRIKFKHLLEELVCKDDIVNPVLLFDELCLHDASLHVVPRTTKPVGHSKGLGNALLQYYCSVYVYTWFDLTSGPSRFLPVTVHVVS